MHQALVLFVGQVAAAGAGLQAQRDGGHAGSSRGQRPGEQQVVGAGNGRYVTYTC